MAREKEKERVSVKCAYCGSDYTVSYAQYRRNGKDHKWKCRRCAMVLMSDEDKAKRSKKIVKALGDKSPEEKAEMTRKRLITIDNDEFRAMKKAAVQKAWSNKSAESLKAISDKASANTTNLWANMDPEVRKRRLKKMHDGFDDWYANLSPEEKRSYRELTKMRSINYWSNVSVEERIAHGKKSSRWWNSLSDEERSEFIRNNPSISRMSKLTDEFIKRMKSSKYIIHTEVVTGDTLKHTWDIGIYDGDELVMLIDIDGRFFHGDSCDYSSASVKVDESRWLSIPPNTRYFILYEDKFDECMNQIYSILDMSYNEFIEYKFKTLKGIPFPTPRYSDKELLISWVMLKKFRNKPTMGLSTIVDFGRRLLNHFHPSIWNDIEPNWHDEKWLMDHLISNQIYHSYLNTNKLLIGFHRDVLSPALCKAVISKHVPDKVVFNPVGDPSILLGVISLGKKFVGPLTPETTRMVEFILENDEANVSLEGDYDCIVARTHNDEDIDYIIKHYQCANYLFITNNTNREVIDQIFDNSYFTGSILNVVKIRR